VRVGADVAAIRAIFQAWGTGAVDGSKQRIVRSLRFLFEGAVLGEIADASQFQVPDAAIRSS
jgi:hypothetical protein